MSRKSNNYNNRNDDFKFKGSVGNTYEEYSHIVEAYSDLNNINDKDVNNVDKFNNYRGDSKSIAVAITDRITTANPYITGNTVHFDHNYYKTICDGVSTRQSTPTESFAEVVASIKVFDNANANEYDIPAVLDSMKVSYTKTRSQSKDGEYTVVYSFEGSGQLDRFLNEMMSRYPDLGWAVPEDADGYVDLAERDGVLIARTSLGVDPLRERDNSIDPDRSHPKIDREFDYNYDKIAKFDTEPVASRFEPGEWVPNGDSGDFSPVRDDNPDDNPQR